MTPEATLEIGTAIRPEQDITHGIVITRTGAIVIMTDPVIHRVVIHDIPAIGIMDAHIVHAIADITRIIGVV